MEVIAQSIPEILLIKPRKFEDSRGYFCETYNEARAKEFSLPLHYGQDNQSLSRKAGTVRGLHFQIGEMAQAKLVRVLKGRILDVAVDIRKGSPTYGQHVKCEISADAMEQIFIPVGFAHAFCTLEPDTEVFYKVTNLYSPAHEMGILWNDPDLGIDWPVKTEDAALSDKDIKLPRLKDLPDVFQYEPLPLKARA
jgi:dTDP-4-dehydrorhamnose 3,5-epimerase